MLANLANVDADLVSAVATSLGKPVPKGKPARGIEPSPALSLVPDGPASIEGRLVGLLAGDGVDASGVISVSRALERAGASVVVIADHGGSVEAEDGPDLEVTKSSLTTQSVEYDALVVAGGRCARQLARDPYVAVNLGEAFRHGKTIAAWGLGVDVVTACAIGADDPGVVTAPTPSRAFAKQLVEAISWHRHWDRSTASTPRPPA
jgi:catalase